MKRPSASTLAVILIALSAIAQAAGAAQPELRLGKPNSRLVLSAFVMTHSPDGKWIAVTTYDGVVNVIDASVPRVVRKFSVGDGYPQVEFLGDRTIAVGGKGGRITLWDAQSGVPSRVLREGGQDISPMDVSHDGARIAFSGFRSSISVVDTETGRSIAELDPGGEFVNNVMLLKISPDGRRLASASMTGDVTVWDLEKSTIVWSSNVRTGEQELVSSGVAGPHYGMPDRVTKIEYSSDGRAIAVDGPDEQVFIVEADSGKTLSTLSAMSGSGSNVESLAFMPDGRSLIVGYASGILRRVTVADDKEIFSVQGPGRIDGISVDPDGARLRTLEREGFVVIRDAATGRTAKEGMARELWSAVYTKDGKLLAAGANDGSIDLFEMPGGKFLRRIDAGGKPVFHVAFSPDDRMFAATDFDTVRLWDPRTGVKLADINPEGSYVHDFAFSSDSQTLFLSEHGSITEWDPHRGVRLREFAKISEYIEDLTVSPDGRYVAAGNLYGRALLWDRKTGKEIFRKPDAVEPWTSMTKVAFTANGRELAGLLSRKNELCRFSVPEGKLLEKLSVGQCVQGTVPTSDGIAIVSKDDCKLARWTVKAVGREGKLKTLHKDFFGGGRVVGASPDGRRWVTSGDDGVLSVWRAP